MKRIAIAILLGTFCNVLNYCQTLFDQGDLVVVGVNANNVGCSGVTAEDKISLISFIDITPGTVLHMTDNGWERTTANLWGDTEGFYVCTYNGPGNIPAGTVFTFTFPNAASPTCPNWTFTTINTLNMNSGGDQLYIMQSGVWSQGTAAAHDATYTGGRFLCAFNTGTAWTSFGSSTQQSGLHPSVPCVSFVVSGTASDFVRYSGPLTITNRYNWYLRFTTSANWTSTDGNCTNYNTNFTLASIPIDATFTIATWDGSSNNNWFDCTNWSTNRVPNEYTDVIVPSGTPNSPVIDHLAQYSDNFQDTARCHDISLNGEKLQIEASILNVLSAYGTMTISAASNSQLDMSDGIVGTADGLLYLKGNWINNKGETDFKQGDSKVIFFGANNQTVTIVGAGPEIFYHVIVNKTGGNVTLNDNVEVCGNSTDPITDRNGILTLTNYNIITGSFYLYVTNPATTGISGGSSASFVDGNLRRHTNTINLYDFPTGEGTRYMRAGVRTTNASENVIEVDAQNTGYGTYAPLEIGIFDVSHLRWWDVTRISGSTPVNVRLYWLGTPTSEGITNVSDLFVAHWTTYDHAGTNTGSNKWWNRGRNVGSSSGLITDGYVEGSENESSFSPHTFGTLTNLNPLPVELLSFSAKCSDNNVVLEWTTASESNSDKFEVQGSTNGFEYTTLATVGAAGFSNSEINYSVMITNSQRNTYFQLKQLDMNGVYLNFEPIYQYCEINNQQLQAIFYYNQIQLILPDDLSSDIYYTVTDLSGKTILTSSFINSQSSMFLINIPELMVDGIYIISVFDNSKGKQYHTKFLKIR